MARKASLPDWAKAIAPGKIDLFADHFYPELLMELGVEGEAIDQYWLEVAYQCAKLDVQNAIRGTDLMPKVGGALCLFVQDPDKRWSQKNYPEGKGAESATKGKEARDHYTRIRGGF
ncbi:hypothetical protein [Sedimenticola selenatireducens]|uniref:Uncharacterized protein n=1 Tax=Sedimenticola selenatireducens TaxID=191960 RepID=A0A557SCK3_9GAMM|nr:hypothetical protein [Sedimenticola selenatireducens]TVO75134.1 hypothetical protein FHP88_08970 [Sedimenticola selenatireducens]TVT67011.1 MAG: hypothetical protein FHK78_01385 [Sedimenticola selenatireducens]